MSMILRWVLLIAAIAAMSAAVAIKIKESAIGELEFVIRELDRVH